MRNAEGPEGEVSAPGPGLSSAFGPKEAADDTFSPTSYQNS